jgi:hypothetical protein
MNLALDHLARPAHLWSRADVFARDSPVPRSAGIYAWYFSAIPAPLDASDCHAVGGSRLLYVGIAPKSATSSSTLRTRILSHYGRANASGSTLRLTLGVLLGDELGIQLQPSGTRLTFGSVGEQRLSAWMAENARVCWHATPEPWAVEPLVIQQLDLPLNLEHNAGHAFQPRLTQLRAAARARARLR